MRIRVGEEDVVIVGRCHDYSATSSKLNPLVVLIVVVVVVTVEKEEEEEKNDETECSYVGTSLARYLCRENRGGRRRTRTRDARESTSSRKSKIISVIKQELLLVKQTIQGAFAFDHRRAHSLGYSMIIIIFRLARRRRNYPFDTRCSHVVVVVVVCPVPLRWRSFMKRRRQRQGERTL